VLNVAIGAVLIALGAGVAYLLTDSLFAMRVLWIAGPIALMAIFFVLLQAWLPRDDCLNHPVNADARASTVPYKDSWAHAG
jgi:hypothetical protein